MTRAWQCWVVVVAACGSGGEAAVDAAGPDGGSEACLGEGALAVAHVAAPVDVAVVETAPGWVFAYGVQDTREVWWSSATHAGQVTPPVRVPGDVALPRLARDGDRVLLVYARDAGSWTWWAQPMTAAGAPVGDPVALAPPAPGANVSGVLGDGGDGFRVVWFDVHVPDVPPVPFEWGDLGVVRLTHDGAVRSTGAMVTIHAPAVTGVAARADGSIAIGTVVRRTFGTCNSCGVAGLAAISAGDAVTDLGEVPQASDTQSRVTSFAAAGATTYVGVQGATTWMFEPPLAVVTRFPLETALVTPRDTHDFVIAGLAPAAGVASYRDGGGAWLQRFTDIGGAFTLGARCRLAAAPSRLVPRDADRVLAVIGGHAQVFAAP